MLTYKRTSEMVFVKIDLGKVRTEILQETFIVNCPRENCRYYMNLVVSVDSTAPCKMY